MNFALIQHHNWSLTELDNMISFERQIYVEMLSDWIEKENEQIEQQRQQAWLIHEMIDEDLRNLQYKRKD